MSLCKTIQRYDEWYWKTTVDMMILEIQTVYMRYKLVGMITLKIQMGRYDDTEKQRRKQLFVESLNSDHLSSGLPGSNRWWWYRVGSVTICGSKSVFIAYHAIPEAILTAGCLWNILTEIFEYFDMWFKSCSWLHRQTTIVDQKTNGKSRTNMFGDWLWCTEHVWTRVEVMEWSSVADHPVDKGHLWAD